MDAQKIAARFAAYTWYQEIRSGNVPPVEAACFAQDNWQTFLPIAPEGLGRLLLTITQPRMPKRQHQERRRRAEHALVCC